MYYQGHWVIRVAYVVDQYSLAHFLPPHAFHLIIASPSIQLYLIQVHSSLNSDAFLHTVQKIGRIKKGVRRSKLSYLSTKIYYFAQETKKLGMMERSIY